MMKICCAAFAVASISAVTLIPVTPAAALTVQECSAKYEAAKKANTLNGVKWNDFRKAQCGADAKPAAASTSAPAAPTAATAAPAPAAKPAAVMPAPATAPKPAAVAPAAMPAATNAVFPKAIDPKYAKEKVGTGRQKTCVDQYNANKASNANGGMKWIEKGGGYWSACDKALKGA